jgi:hypothetical protein
MAEHMRAPQNGENLLSTGDTPQATPDERTQTRKTWATPRLLELNMGLTESGTSTFIDEKYGYATFGLSDGG